jgi:predicted amidohydrolase
MKRMIRVSAVQMPTVIDGASFKARQKENRRILGAMLKTAGERGSDLVLFGEYANLNHRTWSKNRREYVPDPIPGTLTKSVGQLARRYRMNVALPLFGSIGGVRSSYVVLFDRRGRLCGCYQKAHPTIAEQRAGIRPGDSLPVFPLDGVTVGIMTCMDIEYPEVAQVLMLKGAEILLFPHVQGSWGEVDWEVRYRARAIDTGLYVVSACYGYPEGEWMPGKMIGRSSVIGRDGLILADIGRGIGMVTVDLDLEKKRRTEFFFPAKHDRTLAVTASRRPEIYHDLTDDKYGRRALARIRAEALQLKRRTRTGRS